MSKTKPVLRWHLSYKTYKKSLKTKQTKQNKLYKILWFGKPSLTDEVKGWGEVVDKGTNLEEARVSFSDTEGWFWENSQTEIPCGHL